MNYNGHEIFKFNLYTKTWHSIDIFQSIGLLASILLNKQIDTNQYDIN